MIGSRSAEKLKKHINSHNGHTQVDLTQSDELDGNDGSVDDVTKNILSSVEEIVTEEFAESSVLLQQPPLMNGCVEMKRLMYLVYIAHHIHRYQLLAVEWMKNRETNKNYDKISCDETSQENIRISLPIEGLLEVSGTNMEVDGMKLWTQLFGLPIFCPERIHGQAIPSVPVCYYSHEEIRELLIAQGHPFGLQGLKRFWYVHHVI